jgi:penicillin-binding protein 1C
MKVWIRHLWQKKTVRFSIIGFAGIFIVFLLLDVVFPFHPKIHYSQIVTARDSSILYTFLSQDDKWRLKTEQPEIMPQLREAILFKEDKYFYFHPGINPMAVGRAITNNLLRRKKTSGASTITMQVARLLQPRQRTYGNKLIEMFRALQLEWHYSKDEILQMYLNLVPYGGNVEGIKSAALLYFGTSPEKLSLAQVMTLAIVPNRPTSLYLGRNNDFIKKERNRWLNMLPSGKIFPEKDIEDAMAEPLEVFRHESPKKAPHFSLRMRKKYPDTDIIRTSLDPHLQNQVENIAMNYAKRLKSYYINNLAVLVVNNQTHETVAYMGSQDFNDNNYSGQVDGVKAIRSPGSTLKPLIYALAFDEGKITPKTMLMDVPTSFGNFVPDNFDEKFHGAVSAERALSLSLNIPAVKLLEEVGVPLMVKKLKQAGFQQIAKDEKKLGLSLALGGCGVTLEELVALYSKFAESNEVKANREGKLVSTQDSLLSKSDDFISPSAAYVITQILTLANRPDLPNNYQSSYHIPKIAWKTGTSYGRRDAWSIGYNKTYTIGVWIGNFTGMGVHELTGADMATPLLFSIFNSIDYNSPNDWFKAPAELKVRLVCPETGKVPGEFCENKIVDYYLPLISPSEKCEHLKEVAVSADEKISYCTACMPMKNYIKRLYSNLSPELAAFYESQHISYQKVPLHNPECNRVFDDKAPAIVMPANGSEYIVEKTSPPQIELVCHADNEVKTVYWYIDDKFYKSAAVTDKVFFTPQTGKIKISCSDDKGRNTNIFIKVLAE